MTSLQNVPKPPQITLEVPKIMHLGHFFLDFAIQFFFTVPYPSMGQILHPNLSTWSLEYLIPSSRILRGNWTKQIVESSSNPITRLPIDSKKKTEFTSLIKTDMRQKQISTKVDLGKLAKIVNSKGQSILGPILFADRTERNGAIKIVISNWLTSWWNLTSRMSKFVLHIPMHQLQLC